MEDEQEFVAAVLRSMPPPEVRGDFVARVNARIDETAGWLGLADFRAWTLRLAPVAAALAIVALLWHAPASSSSSSTATVSTDAAASSSFSPASSSDWQQDVSGDALLEAALRPAGGSRAR
jgi:hypothetical protein